MKHVHPVRALLALIALPGLASCATNGGVGRLPETAGAATRVVLVSVAGLTAEALPHMPTLQAMADAGVVAERLSGVAPASKRPAHATLVTGATPAAHGIVAERRLGDRGVRDAGYDHASLLRTDTLWQRGVEAGVGVAALDWPTTLGAAIPELLPDLGARGRERAWSERLRGETTPAMLERVTRHGGDAPESGAPGPVHDAVVGGVACDLARSDPAPRLLLLRLSQAEPVLLRLGPEARAVDDAFAAVDRALRELLLCLDDAGALVDTAVAVVGDHGVDGVHTEIAPNAVLVREGLIDPRIGGTWSAIARSNGGSAFVYAR
ncbi:MAG: alkaline phosphatase family protein, partial [Myxococcota bacterium]